MSRNEGKIYAMTTAAWLHNLFEAPSDCICLVKPKADGALRVSRPLSGIKDAKTFLSFTHACVSTVEPKRKDDEYYMRTADRCLKTKVLMLDDVGTKVDPALIAPGAIPHYKIETSPDNFQYLYKIEEEDPFKYQAMMRMVAEKGLCDEASGLPNQLFRLPGSDPKGKGFEARCLEVNPGVRRYDMVALGAALLGFEPVVLQDMLQDYRRPKTREQEAAYPVNDPLLDWLVEHQGMNPYDVNGRSWIMLDCPWAHDHTEEHKTTAYYNPLGQGDTPSERGFKCFHSNCKHRTSLSFNKYCIDAGAPAEYFDMQSTSDLIREVQDRAREVDETRQSEDPDEPKERDPLSLYDKHRTELFMYADHDKVNLPDVELTTKGPANTQLATRANVEYMIIRFNMKLKYNLMTKETEVYRKGDTGDQLIRLLIDMAQKMGIKNEKTILTIMDEIAMENMYHPMQLWLDELVWDGNDHIGNLTKTVTVAAAGEALWPIFLTKWMKQAVEAVCGWENPQGVPYVLTFSGMQGVGKGKWFARLLPTRFYSEGLHLDLSSYTSSRDSIVAATKTPVAELGELDTTFGMSKIGALKAYLSRREDIFRMPYAPSHITIPRCTAYLASVNTTNFLMDPTGARRFWPVHVLDADYEHKVDTQAAWAQAYALWKEDKQYWLTEEEEAAHLGLCRLHTQTSEIDEKLDEFIALRHPDSENERIGMAVTDVIRFLSVDNILPNRAAVEDRLNKTYGPKRTRVGKKQNCWAIPIAEAEA